MRITVTKKGRELQDQLRDQAKKESQQNVIVKQQQGSSQDLQLKQGPNANDQLDRYADIVENRLTSPKQIKDYLTTKYPNKEQIMSVQRELEKIGTRVYSLGSKSTSQSTLLPTLDFKQRQYMKTKYNGSSDSGLFRSDIFSQTGGTFMRTTQQDESKSKKVNFMMFLESKLDRMVKKFEQFNEKTKSQPRFPKGAPRDIGQLNRLLKSMECGESETRVESIQELNSRHSNQLQLLEYNTQYKDRQRLAISELHHKRYRGQWERVHLPGKSVDQQ